MRPRLLALLWLALGVAVWCGFFDLYIGRATRWYLELRAEYALHMIQDEPSMTAMMARARHEGAIAASCWAGAIVIAGWVTIAARGKSSGT